MPGLRGFSKSNLKNMRMFYEQWSEIEPNSPVATGELPTSTVSDNSPAVADEFNSIQLKGIGRVGDDDFPMAEFLQVPFTHHSIIGV